MITITHVACKHGSIQSGNTSVSKVPCPNFSFLICHTPERVSDSCPIPPNVGGERMEPKTGQPSAPAAAADCRLCQNKHDQCRRGSSGSGSGSGLHPSSNTWTSSRRGLSRGFEHCTKKEALSVQEARGYDIATEEGKRGVREPLLLTCGAQCLPLTST